MSLRKPLVIAIEQETPTQQLQSSDDLDIPVNEKVSNLERKLNGLIGYLTGIGLEIPDEVEVFGEG